jgi:excisionase family DNA binding protein
MPEDLVLVSDAARELGVSRWAVWHAIKTQRLPSFTLGRFRVIRRDDLEEFKRTRRGRGRPRKADA